jgi:hypothetical protein
MQKTNGDDEREQSDAPPTRKRRRENQMRFFLHTTARNARARLENKGSLV